MNRFRRALALSLSLAAPALADGPDDDVELARRDFESGTLWQAEDTLRAILEDDPEHRAARVLLVRVLDAEGKIADADDQDAWLAEHAAADLSALLARAEHAFVRGRYADSEALGRAVLAAAPADLGGHYMVARALWERGRRQEAREQVAAAQSGLSKRAFGADELLGIARLRGLIGELEAAAEAAVYAEQARKKEGRPTTDVLVVLGDLYRRAHSLSNETPRAFKTYRDALEQNPSLVDAKVGRALVHIYTFNAYEAEQEIDAALAINGSSVAALAVKASFRVSDGRYGEALELVERALAVNPAAKIARAQRAAALYLLGRTAEYAAEVERVLAIDPTYGELYQIVGDAVSQHFRYAEAVELHRRALALDPELPLALVSLGRDLCFTGAEKEGKEALIQSEQTHPFPYPWRNNMLLVLQKFERDYVTREGDGCRFRVHSDEDPLLAPRLRAACALDLTELGPKYGHRLDAELLIELLATHQDFSVRSVGFLGLGALGACFGNLVTLLSPRSEMRGTFVWRRTIRHELAHVMTLGRSKGRVPRWLTEGFSVYEERATRPGWARDQEAELQDAYVNGEVIPLREFNGAFRGPRIIFAYYQGGLWVEYAAAKYGLDKVLAMLDAYAEDLETEDVVRRVFDRTPEQMDEEFRAYLYETRLKDLKLQPTYSARTRNEMRRRLKQEPANADLAADVAWAFWQAGGAVDADVYLEQALKLDPGNPKAHRLAAERALRLKRADLAVTSFETAFQNGGEEYRAALQLAKLRSKAEDHDGAEAALRIALKCFPADISPENPDLALYEALRARGAVAEAMEHLRAFVDRAEFAAAQRLELAKWLQHASRHQEALRYLDEAEDVDPFVRELHERKADSSIALGKPADAIAALRSALLVDPRFEPGYTPPPTAEEREEQQAVDRRRQAEILTRIGEIELTAGDAAAAARDLERALSLDPALPEALELKARLAR